jgi:hypothetical protein
MRGVLVVVIVAATAWQSLGFEHEWTTVQEQMWGWMGDDVLEVEGQLEFFANNYRSGSPPIFQNFRNSSQARSIDNTRRPCMLPVGCVKHSLERSHAHAHHAQH